MIRPLFFFFFSFFLFLTPYQLCTPHSLCHSYVSDHFVAFHCRIELLCVVLLEVCYGRVYNRFFLVTALVNIESTEIHFHL